MNLKALVLLYVFLCIGFSGVYANEPENVGILQSIIGIIQKFLEFWKKWLNDKQIESNTTPLPINNSTVDPFAYSDLRLPNKTIPINYNLTIKAFYNSNFKKEENFFEGYVKIKLSQESPSNIIIFHLDPSLQILDQISVSSLTTEFKPKVILSRHLANQLYQIVFDQEIPKDQYLMEVSFKGDYGSENNLVGFHKINYYENGLLKTMLATKFQPADSRKAFPCFDEPAFKATFDITIEHPSDSIALGNWPEISNENFNENGKVRYRRKFATTFKMPTYLAAWFIGPLDYTFKATTSTKNISIKVWGTTTNIQNGYLDFALELAKKSLDFLENIYMNDSAPVPPKLDILSIPRTQSGASENWGLINLRENLILYSNQNTKLAQKQATAITLAHEISHSWFGNYLTVKFWQDAWLKEAMSNFLAYKTVQNIYPDFDQMRQYISTAKVPIMMEDSYSTTLPVAIKADNLTPDQILNMFTTITYDKGVSILIMIEKIVGEDNFKFSLRDFIHKFRFGVADADLFYESIKLPAEFNGISTKIFVENWLYQKNFPEIKVRLSYANNRAIVNFEQKRFFFNPLNETEQEDFPSQYNNQWIVFIKCRVGGNIKSGNLNGSLREFSYVLDQKKGVFQLDQEYSWIKCNSDFQGYFLVNYDIPNYQAFNQILSSNYSAFSAEDRAGIVQEIFYLTMKGDKPYSLIKDISQLISKNENTFLTWSVFIWNLKKLAALTEYRPSFKKLSDYLVPLLTTKYNVTELFNDPEVHTISQIKSEILDILCRLENEECIAKASELFDLIPDEYFSDPVSNVNLNNLKQNQRSIVYKYAVKNSPTDQRWYKLFDLYLNSAIPSERENALNGLASSTRIWQLETLYEEAFKQNSKIRNEDFYPMMSLIGKSSSGRDFFWRKFQTDFNKIGSKFGFDIFLILTLKDGTENFENTPMLNELTTTFPLNGTSFSLYIRHIRKYIIQNIYWNENLENEFLNQISQKGI